VADGGTVTTQAAKKPRARTAKKTEKQPEPDDRGRWLTDLERSLLRFHQDAAQRRGRLRAQHRMPFVQCRHCDELRKAAVAEKQQRLQGEAPTS